MAVFRRTTETLPGGDRPGEDRPGDDDHSDDTPATDSAPVDNGTVGNGDYARVPTPPAASPAARQRVDTQVPPVQPLDPVNAPAPLTPEVVDTTPVPQPVESPAVAVLTGAVADEPNVAAAGGDDLGDVEGDAADNARRWREVMIAFVDGPSEAVDAAQALVSDELARVVRVLEGERDRLRTPTAVSPSTEDLRVTVRALRTLSERLHAIA